MVNFNKPNIYFWELGEFDDDNVTYGNEDRKYNLVDGVLHIGKVNYGLVSSAEVVRLNDLEWFKYSSDLKPLLNDIAKGLGIQKKTLVKGKLKSAYLLLFQLSKAIFNQ